MTNTGGNDSPLDTSFVRVSVKKRGVIFLVSNSVNLSRQGESVSKHLSFMAEKKKKKVCQVGNPFMRFIPHTDFDVVLPVITFSLLFHSYSPFTSRHNGISPPESQ